MTKNFNGLSDAEAIASREKDGCNALPVKKGTPFYKKLLNNFTDPIIRILLFALLITVILPGGDGSVFESVGIAAAILISTLVSTLSEHSSEKAFRKMQDEARRQSCTVIRNGKHVILPVEEVVIGDLVCLFPGEKVPADGYTVDGCILCDESALSGESKEIEKKPSERRGTGELSDACSLFRGSTVTSGEAIMTVTAVGEKTFYGNMAGEVQSEGGKSPLKEKLSGLARTLSRFGYICAAAVAAVYLINAFFLDGGFVPTPSGIFREVVHAVTLAVSVVVVAVPEGLPMMITVVLSSNMLRMQKESIRVRKPVGIETAGRINILFTDKTGTLTYGAPTAAGYVTGDCSRSGRCADLPKNIRFLLGAAALSTSDCIIESPFSPEKRRIIGGNATDRAVLNGYFSAGEYQKAPNVLSRLGFDSRIKLSAAAVELSGARDAVKDLGTRITFIKGAPEILIKSCRGYYTKNGEIKPVDIAALNAELNKMTERGTRVIAVVTSDADADTVTAVSRSLKENTEPRLASLLSGVNFVCFIAIRDELRREAPKAIKTLNEAGIQVVMITGDSLMTASAIAREAGIIRHGDGGAVIESSELKNMSDAEVARLIPSLRVVARALPSDKSRLVKIAKSLGLITGMTGDGINDAPALKLSDVGFAMGSGTEVAKEAGDIIITDNNIASIVKTVLYGRTVFRSIRKFIVFQLTMNLSAVGISIIGPFISFENPVTVMQMLWINIIMDTLAALAFAGEAPRRFFMKEPPIPKSEPVLNGDMITKIFVMGAYTVMLCLFYHQSTFIRELFGYSDQAPAFLSGFFALFVFSGIFGAFNARASRLDLFSGLLENPVFITVMSLVFTVQMGLIYRGGELFRSYPLSPSQLKTVVLLAFTVIPVGRLLELINKIGTSDRVKNAKKSTVGPSAYALIKK